MKTGTMVPSTERQLDSKNKGKRLLSDGGIPLLVVVKRLREVADGVMDIFQHHLAQRQHPPGNRQVLLIPVQPTQGQKLTVPWCFQKPFGTAQSTVTVLMGLVVVPLQRKSFHKTHGSSPPYQRISGALCNQQGQESCNLQAILHTVDAPDPLPWLGLSM